MISKSIFPEVEFCFTFSARIHRPRSQALVRDRPAHTVRTLELKMLKHVPVFRLHQSRHRAVEYFIFVLRAYCSLHWLTRKGETRLSYVSADKKSLPENGCLVHLLHSSSLNTSTAYHYLATRCTPPHRLFLSFIASLSLPFAAVSSFYLLRSSSCFKHPPIYPARGQPEAPSPLSS